MANWRSYIDPSTTAGQNTLDGIIDNGPTYGIGISDDLSVTGLSTFSDIARFSSTVRLDGQLRDGDNAFGTSGQVLSSDGTDTKWVNAGSLAAGAASLVAINDGGSDNASRFITFVDSSSGNNALKVDSIITYHPLDNILSLSATESGIKFGAGDALNDDAHIEWLGGNNAGYLRISTSDDGGSEYIQFGDYDNQNRGGTFTEWLRISRDTGTFTGTFSATTFSGSGASLTSLNASNISSGTINAARVPTLNQNTTGSAATLTTARTIGGVSFDGSANINLPGVNQSGNQDTSGNAATATVLETTRAFSITGEVTANSVNFNGSGGVTLNATVDDNVIDYNNLKASNRTSASNGQYLRKRSGNTGGMTWEDIPVVTGSNLSGNTLSSGIVNSSLTSLGTLSSLAISGNITVGGNASITGTANIDNTITLDSKNEEPSHDKGVVIIQPSTSGGRTGINFRSRVNSDSDHGYLWWYDDNNNYANDSGNAENGVIVLGVQNDASSSGAKDAVAIESSGNIFLNPGLNDNNYGGTSGPDFGRGKVYIGRESTKYQVWHEGNDGPSSGLNADLLDGEEGTYYRNAGNLNAGTIPAARLPNHSASLLTSGTIPAARLPNHSASLLTSGTIPDARISGNFLRSNTDDSMSGLLTLNKSANRLIVLDRNISSPSNYFNDLQMEIRATNGTAGIGLHRSGFSHVGIYHDSSGSVKFNMNNGTTTLNGTTGTVWGSGNDGSGSGLDADLLDGYQRVDVMNYNNLSNKPTQFSDVRSMNEAASPGESTTTSTSNQTKVTLSISTVSNSRVMILYGFDIAHGDTSQKTCIATVEGTNVSFVGSRSESNRSTAFETFHGNILDISSHTGTRTYRIVFRRSTGTGGNARIRNAYLSAIEMSV